jgi:hypothetical protein
MNDFFKMGWFVDAYTNNTIDFNLFNTGKAKGTAVLPTGAGKSGMIYADIIKHILISNDSQKHIFNLSAPILKLEAQLLNDLISVLSVIFPDKINNKEFMFFINSSADGNAYDADLMNADVLRFNEIDKFIRTNNAKFAIIASCHKSLYKFAEQIDYLSVHAKIHTYLDEAHLVVNENRDDMSFSKSSEEKKKRFNTLTEICKSNYLYALTATPDKYVTEEINKSAGEDDTSMHIIDIPARVLIAENKILPVKTWVERVGNGEGEKITPDICLNFMRSVIADNDKINHKILVTCSSVDHLNALREALGSYYKVFSTCSRDGGMSTVNNEENVIDEVSFIKEVDSWNDNCFVLHIRQLTQGIDVKTLTDCIIYNSTRLNDGVKRIIVQTIGRTIRPMAGERGLSKDKRIKKDGNVLFLIGDNDYDAVKNQTTNFLLQYYGRDGIKAFTKDIDRDYGKIGKNKIKFGNGSSGFGDDYYDYFETVIDKLLIDMEDYIQKNILPKYKLEMKLSGNKQNRKLIPSYLVNMKEKFALYSGIHDTSTLLSDTEFMKKVSELFAKYNIE